jgi:hypothetical protein
MVNIILTLFKPNAHTHTSAGVVLYREEDCGEQADERLHALGHETAVDGDGLARDIRSGR